MSRKFDPGKMTVADLADLGCFLGIRFDLVLVPTYDSAEYGALLEVAGAARTYRADAKLGRKALLAALERLDTAQTPTETEP